MLLRQDEEQREHRQDDRGEGDRACSERTVDDGATDQSSERIREIECRDVCGRGKLRRGLAVFHDPHLHRRPLANHRRIETMEAMVADARAKGARVLAGGSRIGNRGYYFPLTVLADLPDDARAMYDEPFGPLALVNPVKSLDEAIEKANSLPYALAAYAFTHSARNVDRLADGIEAGNLSINNFVASISETPFRGVKESGYGREGGTDGLQHYTVVKNVSHLVM